MNYVALFLATDGATYLTEPLATEEQALKEAQRHIRTLSLTLMGPIVVTVAEES